MSTRDRTRAQALADGTEMPAGGSDSVSQNFSDLHRLFQAFNATSEANAEVRPCLFRWRHLEVEQELGKGGFGQVYRAWDSVLKRPVALKLVPADAQSELRDRLMIAEAQRMAKARHPNILAVHGADIDSGRAGIWSDLLTGETLEDLIRKDGPVSSDTAIFWAIPLVSALDLMHRRAMSHGDVKPSNIMIEPDGTPVLVDFGAVQAALGDPSGFGSPVVMAPEQFAGSPASPATDLYALGCTLFFALTGSYPLKAGSFEELARRHHRKEAGSMNGVPREWRDVLARCLDANPKARATCSRLGDLLQQLRTRRSRRRKQLAIGGICLSLALVAGIATWAAFRLGAEAERVEQIKNVVIEAVDASLPEAQSGPASVTALFSALSELGDAKLQEYPLAQAELQLIAARGLFELGHLTQALGVAEQGHQTLIHAEPDAFIKLGKSLINLSSIREELGDMEGAQRDIEQALALLSRGPDELAAPARLTAYNRLANLAGEMGDWHRGADAHQKLLGERLALYGEKSVRAAVDYYNIGTAQNAFGGHASALENFRMAEALLVSAGDGESLRMGYVLLGLAIALVETGRLDEAQAGIDRARNLMQASLPDDSSRLHTLEILQAKLDARNGNLERSRATLEAILARDKLSSTSRHQANRQLALYYASQGHWRRSQDTFQWLIEESATRRYRAQRIYYEAAVSYTAFRAGSLETSPKVKLEAAIEELSETGYAGLSEYEQLKLWRETLRP
ncbi:MAG: serine/threonine-protein kinase [Pseudomonadota bacterium]